MEKHISKRQVIEKEISEIEGEVTYARKFLISQKIEADEFKKMKSAYNLRLDRSKAKHSPD